jgi:hypothetical protein
MKDMSMTKDEGMVKGTFVDSFSDRLVQIAPWWLISVGFHIVALLVFTLISIDNLIADPGASTIIQVISPLIEQKPDILEQPNLSSDESEKELYHPTYEDNDDPIIYFPGALPSNHNESANNMLDSHTMKGESEKYLSYLPGEGNGIRGRELGKGSSIYDIIGPGGGGGGAPGRYRNGPGGMYNLRKVPPSIIVTKESLDAVAQGLLWLARHQNEDGSWTTGEFNKHCLGNACSGIGNSSYDVGLTGLAVWAFLCRGYVPESLDTLSDPITKKKINCGKVVNNGIQWLKKVQQSDGCFGEKTGHYMYNHAIASLAMIEAYGMTQSPLLKEPAQKALNFTIDAQNPGLGWRYSVRPGDSDSSVTGWCAMVLKSAEMSGLNFPQSAKDGVIAWYEQVTGRQYGQVGYTVPDDQAVRQSEKGLYESGNLTVQPSLTAIGVLSRIMITKKNNDTATKNGIGLLAGSLPKWDTSKPGILDFYYWYYGTLAMFQFDGPKGSNWLKWNDALSKALLPNQAKEKDGCKCGSWDPDVDRWGSEGGRVYSTAINVLTLEIYYRYPSVFSTGK